MKSLFILIVTISAIFAAPASDSSTSSDSSEDNSLSKYVPGYTLTLSEWLNEVNNTRIGDWEPISTYLNNIDFNCINDELKVSENGDKILNVAQMATLGMIGITKCQKDKSELEVIDEYLQTAMDLYQLVLLAYDRSCFIKELQKIEPSSKLVENFDENEDQCADAVDFERISKKKAGITRYAGDISSFTCDNIELEEVIKFELKLVIIASESDEELKKSEVEKLKSTLKQKADAVFECVLSKL